MLARYRGIEPLSSARQADVLAVVLIPHGRGGESRTRSVLLPKQAPYRIGPHPVAGHVGVEPTSTGLEPVILAIELMPYFFVSLN
jgi:hypothetical protein